MNHVREVRTAFLLKVVLLERREMDPLPLIESQIKALTPVVKGVEESYRGSQGAVSLWRTHSARATLRFLEELAAQNR